MKILITSDIHRNMTALNKILNEHQDLNYHLDAGDSNLSLEFLESKGIISVKGNTDFFAKLPNEKIVNIDDKKMLIIHGHTLKVKKDLNLLYSYAKGLKVDMCIYGHTHIQKLEEKAGIIFLNPGALVDYKYAIYENGKIKLF